MSPFVRCHTLSLHRESWTAPNGNCIQLALPLIDGNDYLNGFALVEPHANDDLLYLWWPDDTVKRAAIRVFMSLGDVLWTPWREEPLLSRSVYWTTISFSHPQYEATLGGDTSSLRRLIPEDAAYLVKMALESVTLPIPEDCRYCIPSVLDDPSGYTFAAMLRSALGAELGAVALCNMTDDVRRLIIGCDDCEFTFDVGVYKEMVYLHFVGPTNVPLWIRADSLEGVLRPVWRQLLCVDMH